jgi:DNA-binding HxlR family transcriptional regulator
VKRYGQRCPLARALDVVGERWSLLIVRELTLGPRRYSDLLDGLPGIPTNLLISRLRQLQEAGVVAKRNLPPPTAVAVYELTEAGRALGPALDALRGWGAHYGPTPSVDDVARPSWVLMSAASRPSGPLVGSVCELRVDGEYFHLGTEDGLWLRGGPAPSPDAVITMDAGALYRLMIGQATPAAVRDASAVDGDPEVADRLLAALHATLADAGVA